MDRTIQRIIDYDKCTGCQLCYNVCRFGAITIGLSKKGFYIPRINFEKCINCGECSEYCPIENGPTGTVSLIGVYAAKSNNDEIRAKSSSGGIFSELADQILEKKGIVFGAGFDDDNILFHMAVNDEIGLTKLRGSKYIQSNIGLSYKKVQGYLNENKEVMFVGTPCQTTALKNYIGSNDNLLLVDLVCHGVPSRIIFEKYLCYIFDDEKPKDIYFRDKQDEGWNNYFVRLEGRQTTYKKNHRKDPFSWVFKNLYLNKICYDCPFCKIPRNSDITLGDFWGVSNELDDNKGISLVLINSNKGQKAFENLMAEKRITSSISGLEVGTKQNPRVIEGHMKIPENRNDILREASRLTFEEIDNQFIKSPKEEVLTYVQKCIRTKPIAIFGTGSGGQKVFDKILKLDTGTIKYFLDNDAKKEGTKFCDVTIYKPCKVQNEKDNIFIVVASSYYDEIAKQLISIGFIENKDFIDGLKYLFFD